MSHFNIPTYQCHKQVQALKIKVVVEVLHEYELCFEDDWFEPVRVGLSWLVKYLPSDKGYRYLVGGYVVWRNDGSMIWMSADAFESDYSVVNEDDPVENVYTGVRHKGTTHGPHLTSHNDSNQKSLRDEFAIAAMNALLCAPAGKFNHKKSVEIVADAYVIADEMLLARDK